MSTSDSDYSIDWLASDEEDSDSVISPPHRDTQPSSTTTTTTTTTTSFTGGPRSPSGSTTTPTTPTPSSNSTDCTLKGSHTDRKRKSTGGRVDQVCRGIADTTRAQGYACTQGYACGRHGGVASDWPFWATAAPPAAPRHAAKRAHGPDLGGHREKPGSKDTEDVLFSHKCVELQRYVQPLTSILQGLSSGRYSQRLSSFQESVAMDRIQRILGVLQNPNMGERFLSTLLQIEKMLQSWFPHVKPRPTVIQSEHSTPAKRQKRHHTSATSPLSSAPSPSTDPSSSYPATSLKWLHTSPICSPKTSGQPPPPSARNPGATQDNAVSSSTDGGHFHRRRPAGAGGRRTARQATPFFHPPAATAPPPPPPFKLRSPCLERLLQAKDSMVSRRTAQEEEEEEEEERDSRGEASCKPPDPKHAQRQRSL